MAKTSESTLKQELAETQKRLKEAEDTLSAIRQGSVDALVVSGAKTHEVYTLQSADYTYRRLIESMNQGALTVNFDGMILYCNRHFSTMLGVPLEQIIGNNVLTFVASDDHARIASFVHAEGDDIDVSVEICLQARGGKSIPAIASATTVHQTGVKPYLCVVITDLTERKQAEDAKDEFISLASHQLRTPSTAVKQYLSMMLDGMFGDITPAQRQAVEKAQAGNDRGLKIVEDLLKVAQIDAGKIALDGHHVDIVELLSAIVAEQSVRLQDRDHRLVYRAPAEPVVAMIDAQLMRMVIENLLDNASKYMPGAGDITLGSRSQDGHVVFTIRDQGIGITEDDLPKLFQKFSRLANSQSIKVGGSGLGLYWVKKVIELHAARIEVESVPGQGTCFTITLPQEPARV